MCKRNLYFILCLLSKVKINNPIFIELITELIINRCIIPKIIIICRLLSDPSVILLIALYRELLSQLLKIIMKCQTFCLRVTVIALININNKYLQLNLSLTCY